ncbi:hypothetical protein [Nocardioides sp.]|uniref:hypothetical protein n=1 Tax=Nocardioides sp. TaxID=35761 RepID=UPI0026076201|nr:hypothetical protein [Nocardioides sp.]
MSTPLALGMLAAASLLLGVAAVAQAIGAARTSGLRVLVQPWYLLGTACDLGGWLLSVLAMRHLPILLVQTALAASLCVTVLLGTVVLGTRPGTRVWGGVAVLLVATGLVALAAETGRVGAVPGALTPLLGVGLLVVAVASAWAYRSPGTARCAALAGLAYSGAAVAARAVHGSGAAHLLTDPLVWLLLALNLIGAVMFARSLETGPHAVNEATAWLWAVELVVPSVVGLAALGDRVRPGWGVPTAAAIAAAVVAACVVSLSGAEELTPRSQEALPPAS